MSMKKKVTKKFICFGRLKIVICKLEKGMTIICINQIV